MPTYNITEIATDTVVFSYASNAPVAYGRADWDDPALFEHRVVADPPPPPAAPRPPMTKWAFRSLFTFDERVICDNAPENTAIPEQYRAAIKTMNKDFDAAQEIDPSLPQVQQGIQLFEQLGLLSAGRANQILFEG
jgi:hypothetical protein